MQTAPDHEVKSRALIQELVTLSARIAAAECRQLMLIRELEDTLLLAFDPFPKWLAWRLGIGLSTAYERIRVARALVDLPVIRAAFAEGRLSYCKVRLLARVATPDTDAKYAALALEGGVRYLEAVVRTHTKIMHAQTEVEAKRYLSVSVDDDGMFIVRGRLAPDEGALLLKALEAAKAATNGDSCQALTQVATVAIDRLATGDDVVLHVQHEQHICAVEGHACAQATAERLLCQNPGNRTASSTQVRALKAMQGGICAHPTCTHARYLDAHHVVPWSKGGRTVLTNLVLICSKHHRLLHEGKYRLSRDEDGRLVFRNQHGLVIDRTGQFAAVDVHARDLADMPAMLVDSRYSGDDPANTCESRDMAMQWLLASRVQ